MVGDALLAATGWAAVATLFLTSACGAGGGVNVTLGLPIVRTSVDHGTALDLAGTGKADPGSLFAAVELAIAMAGGRP